MNYKDIYSYVMVDRNGITKDAYMKTTDIINEIQPLFCYTVSINGLKFSKVFKELSKNKCEIEIPKYLEIEGIWKDTEQNEICYESANILGGSGKFEININEIIIPFQDATKSNLAYYNVKLLKIDEKIIFETDEPLPLCIVDVGEKYIENYILQYNYGGGVYFEYHKNPHFHMPRFCESSGYLMIAKCIDNKYHISAFKIPYGYATYIPPYVLHNDCFLKGEYYVVYSISKHYSTCLLRNKENKIINVKIQ